MLKSDIGKQKLIHSLYIIVVFVTSLIIPFFFDKTPAAAFFASITTSDSISLDVSPAGDGTSIHSESINVQSDCRAGYNLTIATPEGSSLYKYSNNTQADTASFTAVDGTSALSSSNNTNKWGYTLTSNPTSSTVFSPLSTTASVLKTPSQTASPSADINDTFNINYGTKVDNTVDAGIYKMANNGSIVYYLTMDTTCTQYTVSFNPNGGTGTMDDQGIEAGEPTDLSANNFTAPAFGSSYEDANGDTIAGTANTYWRFNGWNTAIDGTGVSYEDEEEVEDLAGIGSTITLYAQWEALTVMLVNYNTNGMEFEDETTTNTLGYYYSCKNRYVSTPNYSHTANISDDGTQIGSTKYANNLATKDVITIPNADSLHVTIKYGTENSYDMLYVFQGEYTGSVTRNMNAGQLAKYMGGNNTTTTVELDIPGDTATFAFYSDGSGQYWGYHATVVGYYDKEPESYASTVEVCGRSLVYGEYQEPASDDDHIFTGWSENSSATTPDYTSATDILDNLQGNNGDTKTLYATWTPIYHITYVNNCITYISGNSSCTQSASNATQTQNFNLNASGNGSGTLKASNAWTTMTGWKIAGWNTSPYGTGTEYEVSSRYEVTGQGAGDGITLYARWAPVYTIQYDGNGADNSNGMGSTDANGVRNVKQTKVVAGDQITLLPTNYRRAGYSFAGWSTSPSATVNGNDKIYGPMETISAPAYPNNATNTITMYAVWIAAEKDGNNNPVYLQDFGQDECDNLTSATFNAETGAITARSVIALTDQRDNQIYTVAKLADGKCWMVDNLRLNNQYTMGQNQNNSSVTNESLSQGYGGTKGVYGNFVGLANSEAITKFTSSTSSNTVYKASVNPPIDTYDPLNSVLEDIGATSNYLYRIPRYNNTNTTSSLINPSYTEDYTNTAKPSTSGTYKSSTVFSYGNYYNWPAAIASTNYHNGTVGSNAADTSICPSGWTLPINYSTNRSYAILSQAMGGTGSSQSNSNEATAMSNRFRSFPNNYIFSSNVDGSSTTYRGSNNFYWTHSANSEQKGWGFSMNATSINPIDNGKAKTVGATIRCHLNDYYAIQYYGSGADNPNGMGILSASGTKSLRQNNIAEGIDVTLLPSNFKRAGYGFAGWSTDDDAWTHFTDNDNSNDPVIYGSMETVTITSSLAATSNANKQISLYAVWVPAKKDGNNHPVYLQDFGTSECSNLTSTSFDSTTGTITVNKNSVIALTDKRDNEIYTVAKLADDNCWMTENLRLESAGTLGNNINDNNVTNQSLSQGYGGITGQYGNFVGLADSESTNFGSPSASNTIYKSFANPPVDVYDPLNNILEDIGTADSPEYRFPRYNNFNSRSLVDSPAYIQNYFEAPTTRGYGTNYMVYSNLYSYGNYYSWAAAMANTTRFTETSVSEAAGTSICPLGWHLPSSGSNSKEYGVLSKEYGGTGSEQYGSSSNGDVMSNRFRAFPNNFILSGTFVDSSTRSSGDSGAYWTRSISDYYNTKTYDFQIGKNYIMPSDYGVYSYRYYGHAIRCLVSSSQ